MHHQVYDSATECAFPISPETVGSLYRRTRDENLAVIGQHLIHRRRIPNYYLRHELRASELMPKEEADKLRPAGWVTEQGRITIDDSSIREVALILFLKIHRRLMHHPSDETYVQARTRLRNTLQELMAQRITRNVLAETLGISPKTISTLLNFSPNRTGPSKHCPWQILDHIATTDWSTAARARQQPVQKATPDSITDGEIQQRRRRQQEIDEKQLYRTRRYIRPRQPCPKCQAPWSMLRPVRDPYRPSPDEVELSCFSCGISCFVKRQPQPAATSPEAAS